MFSRRTLIITFIVVAAAFIGYGIFKIAMPTNLKFTVAPSPATVLLDGTKKIKSGNLHLAVGSHTVTASMNGFASFTRSFTITSGKVTTIGIALTPNSPAGNAYLQAHPDEERSREAITAQNFKAANDQIAKNNPIDKVLPYVAPDNSFRVDYGATPVKTNKTQIYVTAINNQAVEAARNWMTSKGYSPNTLNLQATLEPMLNHLPYKTTDFSLAADYTSGLNGAPKLTIDATIYLSGADAGDPTTATAQYKQEVLSYISSCGVNPNDYTINYTTQQG